MDSRRTIEADVCVVGAGIVGLAHALEARSRGLRVVLLERSERAVGASVRNFGHGCLAAMATGLPLDHALRSRERWIELAGRTGLHLWLDGTLLLARAPDELAVLEALAADGRRGAVVIGPDQVPELAPIPSDGLLGALHARLDYRVNPRKAAGRLAALLEDDDDAVVLWQAHVHEVAPTAVESSRALVRAPLIVLCPGPEFHTLPLAVRPRRDGLTLCKLQMLRVAPPAGRRYGPALMTGLSLLRYPGFADAPGADDVRGRIESDRPDLVERGIHLIVTQLPGGDLIIGDSHEYAHTPAPFAEERVFDLLLAEARRVLGAERLEVRQRWQGYYPVAPGEPYLIEAPLPGVRVVEVVSGIGMTTALGLAEHVMDALLGAAEGITLPQAAEPQSQPASPPRSAAAGAGYGS